MDLTRIDPHSLDLPSSSTCLSPGVRKLITVHTISDLCDEQALDDQGCLNISHIASKLPDAIEQDSFSGDPSAYFTSCVTALAEVFCTVENKMKGCTEENLTHYRDLLHWTGQTELLLSTWKLMIARDDVQDLAALLLTTAILERSLGNLYLLNGAPPCPSMLKDLLVTKELKDVLGQHMIQILRIMIGPPVSLNIRNVAWHGFPYPGEIPRRCIWFIILLVPSIGKILQEKHITSFPCREPVQITDTPSISELLVPFNDKGLLDLVTGTQFVSWDTARFWTNIELLYRQNRPELVSSLLLYYIEQGLRRVFAAVNQCPHRVLTAEATTLYTTLDEILAPSLPDGSENKLRHLLGHNIMEVLFDLLTYQSGPRVRDRLSHGEIDWCTFPTSMADSLIQVGLALAAMFVPREEYVQSYLLDGVYKGLENYEVQFHPVAVLKAKVTALFSEVNKVNEAVHINPDLSERCDGNPLSTTGCHDNMVERAREVCRLLQHSWLCDGLVQSLPDCITAKESNAICNKMHHILCRKISTLYKGTKQQVNTSDDCDTNKEGEIVSLLTHIVCECLSVCTNMQQFISVRQGQLKEKQLRSRQRGNLQKFLMCLPSYIVIAQLVGVLVTWRMYHLDTLDPCTEKGTRQEVRFWKKLQQACENIRTFSTMDKNKWTEGERLIIQHIETIVSYLTSL